VGTLHYGQESFDFDDRVLAHLQFIINQKARRKESFLISWVHPAAAQGGRSSIWISGNSDLHFGFSGSKRPAINQTWLEAMMAASYSSRGLDLDVVPEPPAGAPS
jgi:hypothetical protein